MAVIVLCKAGVHFALNVTGVSADKENKLPRPRLVARLSKLRNGLQGGEATVDMVRQGGYTVQPLDNVARRPPIPINKNILITQFPTFG